MINQRTFLGIPLARRRTRRWLVVGYWTSATALLAFGGLLNLARPGWFAQAWYAPFLGLVCGYLGSMLGGNRPGGPVRDFEGRAADRPELLDNTIRTLMKPANREWQRENRPLDERDIRLRNAAHYEAYRLLELIVLPIAGALFMAFATTLSRYKVLCVPIFVLTFLVVYNLPQSLILWTEQDMEERDER